MADIPDFDAMYAADPDPFRVHQSWYERRKQGVVLALLGRERYGHAWDAACGTGALALALAGRCGRVTASDASARAVALTQELLAGTPRARCLVSALPHVPELGSAVDLVVLAEVLYYLAAADRRAAYAAVLDVVAPDAELVAVHWRHHPDDAHLSGQAVTEELGGALERQGWRWRSRHVDPDFVAASWVPGHQGAA
jgi:SAM-dependent methyltransferase